MFSGPPHCLTHGMDSVAVGHDHDHNAAMAALDNSPAVYVLLVNHRLFPYFCADQLIGLDSYRYSWLSCSPSVSIVRVQLSMAFTAITSLIPGFCITVASATARRCLPDMLFTDRLSTDRLYTELSKPSPPLSLSVRVLKDSNQMN